MAKDTTQAVAEQTGPHIPVLPPLLPELHRDGWGRGSHRIPARAILGELGPSLALPMVPEPVNGKRRWGALTEAGEGGARGV